MINSVGIIGAGLSGCEAALNLASHGFNVTLYEMKPHKHSAAHALDSFCELVCNNSFCSLSRKTPLNLLYNELCLLNSHLVKIIEESRISDVNNIAVDKVDFSKSVTKQLHGNKNINIINKTVSELPNERPLIISTGPLTHGDLFNELDKHFDGLISIQDASSLIIDFDSIDFSKLRTVSKDVFEIDLCKKEYYALENILKKSKIHPLSIADSDLDFQQCMPVESIASLKSGLLREIRFIAQKSHSYATITLRRDDKLNNSVVISGFTTRLTHQAQETVVHSIRGLQHAKIVRYGQMHKNSFIDAPKILNDNYEVINEPGLYVIGQLSGVDGYLAAISSALVSSISILRRFQGRSYLSFPQNTITGGLAKYISTKSNQKFVPMVASFSLFGANTKNNDIRTYNYSLNYFKDWLSKIDFPII